MNKHPLIRRIYLYLFTALGLILVTIGTVRIIGLGLKVFIFTKADLYYDYPSYPYKPIEENATAPSKEEIELYQKNQRDSNRQRDAAESIAMLLVGAPLYLYHWRVVQKDKGKADG